MDVIDNAILRGIFLCHINDKQPIENIKKITNLSEEYILQRMKQLEKNQLLDLENQKLTDLGRTSLKVVLAGGVFDIIHPGHIYTLNSAKSLGDILIVVVATDKTAQKMKNRIPLHNQDQRRMLVDSLSMVDLCVIGNESDIFKTVEKIQPDIIALGYDQVHQEKAIVDGCKKINLNIKVARLQSPIPHLSSSKIEKEYGDAIHGI